MKEETKNVLVRKLALLQNKNEAVSLCPLREIALK